MDIRPVMDIVREGVRVSAKCPKDGLSFKIGRQLVKAFTYWLLVLLVSFISPFDVWAVSLWTAVLVRLS